MEVRAGYKKTELGFIPEDWNLKEFVEVMDGFSSGQTPFRANVEFYRGDIPWITSGELNYNVITDTIEKITIEGAREANLKMIPKGTFLFAITGLEAAGTRGSCAITGIDATTNQSCMALYPKKGLLITAYLYHYYVQNGNELAFKYCQGTKQQSFTGGIAKKLPIIVPSSIEEQTAIANALSDTDSLIARLEKLIAKKNEIKQGVMQTLMEPKAGWHEITYGETFEFLTTAAYSRAELTEYDEVQYVHYGDIHTKWNSFLDIDKNKLPTIANEQVKNYSLLNEGDVIMADASEDYAGIGKSVEVLNLGTRNVIAGQHTFLMRDKNDVFINGFRGYIHLNKIVKTQFDRLATGLKVYGISKNNLRTVKIPVPPKTEQIQIIRTLSDMDTEITALENKLEKYRKVKIGMMQNLLTGKIRLT